MTLPLRISTAHTLVYRWSAAACIRSAARIGEISGQRLPPVENKAPAVRTTREGHAGKVPANRALQPSQARRTAIAGTYARRSASPPAFRIAFAAGQTVEK